MFLETSSPVTTHAFLYSNGQMQGLNGLIDPTLGVTLFDAEAINNSGQILANGFQNNAVQGTYLLDPRCEIDEQCAM